MADHMRTRLVEDALKMAEREAGSLAGVVFHSGHGWGSAPRRAT